MIAFRDIEWENPDSVKEAIKQNGFFIQHVENPNEELQMIAVKKYGEVIEVIKNPSLKTCLEAIKHVNTDLYNNEKRNKEIMDEFMENVPNKVKNSLEWKRTLLER